MLPGAGNLENTFGARVSASTGLVQNSEKIRMSPIASIGKKDHQIASKMYRQREALPILTAKLACSKNIAFFGDTYHAN